MNRRYAIFVDAGYFFSAGSAANSGKPLPRKQLFIKNPGELISSLRKVAEQITASSDFLRVYWYDAPPHGAEPSEEQRRLSETNGVKLRLGILKKRANYSDRTKKYESEQKGVDSLFVTDLIELARNRSISDAVVLTGDNDLRIAVEIAQSFGSRVHVVGIGNCIGSSEQDGNVGDLLRAESDSFECLPSDFFSQHVRIADYRSVGEGLRGHPDLTENDQRSQCRLIAQALIDSLDREELDQLRQDMSPASRLMPAAHYTNLIHIAMAALNKEKDDKLSNEFTYELRDAVWEILADS